MILGHVTDSPAPRGEETGQREPGMETGGIRVDLFKVSRLKVG